MGEVKDEDAIIKEDEEEELELMLEVESKEEGELEEEDEHIKKVEEAELDLLSEALRVEELELKEEGEQIKKEEAHEESEDKAKLELKDEGTLELLLELVKMKEQEETVLATGAMASLNVESERITASELAWRQSMLHVHGYKAVGMWTPRIIILKRKRL